MSASLGRHAHVLAAIVFVAVLGSGCGEDDVGTAAAPLPGEFVGAPFEVRVPDAVPEAVRWAAADVQRYLTSMGRTVSLTTSTSTECIAGRNAIVFSAAGGGAGARPLDEQHFTIAEHRCRAGAATGTVVELGGGGLLGRQYAAYEFLHQLGVRFFHPEEEYVPPVPRWPEAPFAVEHTPTIRWRSSTLHLAHPLDLGDAFRLCRLEFVEEARHYIDWQVKNLASAGAGGACDGELSDYGYRRGFLVESGIGLWGAQQGGTGVIDPDDPRPPEAQVAAAIDARMQSSPRPEAFTVNHQFTEFEQMPDDLVVGLLTFIAEYFAEHYPDVTLLSQVHGTATEPTLNYHVNYNALGQFAPQNMGLQLHTLMFYDLYRPAPVYGNADFSWLRELIERFHGQRTLWYFPEAAWWLTFDLPLPLYLPITIEARDRDLQNLRPFGLQAHKLFGTGHEWGYWQNEYCAFRMAAFPDYRWTDCVADITGMMGTPAAAVQDAVQQVVTVEQRDLFDPEMLRYYVGTDNETEAAAAIGVVFHPLPPKPVEILGWSGDQVRDWQTRVGPALEHSAADYERIANGLDAVETDIAAAGASFFREIRDGVRMNALRLRHQVQAYGALVTFRDALLTANESRKEAARALLLAARQTTEQARTVVQRREMDYRYHPVERAIAGGADGKGDDNWSIYHYRYLNRAHHVFYYTRTDDLAEQAMQGAPDIQYLAVDDALLAPAETLAGRVQGDDVTAISVDFGDGTVTPMSAPGAFAHAYAVPGVYQLVLSAQNSGEPLRVERRIAVLTAEYRTGRSAMVRAPRGAGVIGPLIPGLTFGVTGPGAGAIGFAFDAGGRVAAQDWLPVQLGSGLFDSAPFDAAVPIADGVTVLTSITAFGAALHFPDAHAKPQLTGALGTESIIKALVAVGGFEEVGARTLIAQQLGYTPDTLPERVDFIIQFAIPTSV